VGNLGDKYYGYDNLTSLTGGDQPLLGMVPNWQGRRTDLLWNRTL
jgi:hypothetical protein